MSDTDLSKIVGLIMENPELIEQIKKLAEKEKTEENVTVDETVEESDKTEEASVNIVPPIQDKPSRIRRKELLSALKPYVSEERGRAIDSMMSIVDILDMMRSK